MKRIRRLTLSKRTTTYLTKIQTGVNALLPPKGAGITTKALDAKWKRAKKTKSFSEIRSTLERMASGRKRCMVCEDSKATDIDHFWPRAKYAARAFVWENYLLLCGDCNSKYKHSQFPLDANGNALLIDPTVNRPANELSFEPQTGIFIPITQMGTETVKVFHLNTRQELTKGRAYSWNSILRIVRDLAGALKRTKGHAVDALFDELAAGMFFPGIIRYFVADALRSTPLHIPASDAVAAQFVVRATLYRWRHLL